MRPPSPPPQTNFSESEKKLSRITITLASSFPISDEGMRGGSCLVAKGLVLLNFIEVLVTDP